MRVPEQEKFYQARINDLEKFDLVLGMPKQNLPLSAGSVNNSRWENAVKLAHLAAANVGKNALPRPDTFISAQKENRVPDTLKPQSQPALYWVTDTPGLQQRLVFTDRPDLYMYHGPVRRFQVDPNFTAAVDKISTGMQKLASFLFPPAPRVSAKPYPTELDQERFRQQILNHPIKKLENDLKNNPELAKLVAEHQRKYDAQPSGTFICATKVEKPTFEAEPTHYVDIIPGVILPRLRVVPIRNATPQDILFLTSLGGTVLAPKLAILEYLGILRSVFDCADIIKNKEQKGPLSSQDYAAAVLEVSAQYVAGEIAGESIGRGLKKIGQHEKWWSQAAKMVISEAMVNQLWKQFEVAPDDICDTSWSQEKIDEFAKGTRTLVEREIHTEQTIQGAPLTKSGQDVLPVAAENSPPSPYVNPLVIYPTKIDPLVLSLTDYPQNFSIPELPKIGISGSIQTDDRGGIRFEISTTHPVIAPAAALYDLILKDFISYYFSSPKKQSEIDMIHSLKILSIAKGSLGGKILSPEYWWLNAKSFFHPNREARLNVKDAYVNYANKHPNDKEAAKNAALITFIHDFNDGQHRKLINDIPGNAEKMQQLLSQRVNVLMQEFSTYLANGNKKQVMRCAKEIESLMPKESIAQQTKARAEELDGNAAKAASCYDEAIKLAAEEYTTLNDSLARGPKYFSPQYHDPEEVERRESIAEQQIRSNHKIASAKQDKLAFLARQARSSPQNTEIWLAYAESLASSPHANSDLQRIAQEHCVTAAMQNKELPKAIQYQRKICADSRRASDYHMLAVLLQKNNDSGWACALQTYTDMSKDLSYAPDLINHYLGDKNWQKAVSLLQQMKKTTLETDDNYPPIAENLLYCYFQTNDSEGIRQLSSFALSTHCSISSKKGVAQFHMQQGSFEEATRILVEVNHLEPGVQRIQHDLLICLSKQERFDEIKKFLYETAGTKHSNDMIEYYRREVAKQCFSQNMNKVVIYSLITASSYNLGAYLRTSVVDPLLSRFSIFSKKKVMPEKAAPANAHSTSEAETVPGVSKK